MTGLFAALAWPPSLGISAELDAQPADAQTEWELA